MRTYMDQQPWNNPYARAAIGAPEDAPWGTLDETGRLAVFATADAIPTTGRLWWSTLPPLPGVEADGAILRGWVDPDTFAANYRRGSDRPRALIPVAEVADLEPLPSDELPRHRLPSVAARASGEHVMPHPAWRPNEPCQVWRVT